MVLTHLSFKQTKYTIWLRPIYIDKVIHIQYFQKLFKYLHNYKFLKKQQH